MCGIAGYIDKSGKYKTSCELLKKMTDKMIHRGPDAEGQWIDNKVAMGHRRLAILDLDEKSNQPLFSHDGRFVITYNGEIYNYIELKEELEKKGAFFRTKCDTEVVIEAYRVYGVECFNRFNGMWSFVLYDIERQQVIVCRDRFGIKPLYIVDNSDVFIYASEMKAIIEAFPGENIINETWIYRYLSLAQIEDCDGECFYKNIKNFPTAQYMIYDLKSNVKEFKKYWWIDVKKFHEKWIRGRNPVQTFKKLFESAVSIRLRADVEVGACLSGGLDSSSIVGCVSKKYGKRIHTFSSVYEDVDCNEEKYIQTVNEKWDNVPHYIKPDDESDLIKYIEALTYYHDQPSIDMSMYSGYKVMEEAQKNVKVLLDGQGADELFAGYDMYYLSYIDDLLDKNTFISKWQTLKILAYLKKNKPDIMKQVSTDTLVWSVGIRNSIELFDKNSVEKQNSKRTLKLFTDSFLKCIYDKEPSKTKYDLSNLNERLCQDIIYDSIPCLLHNEDGNSMAFSIEARVPFLDYRIVEFAIALDCKYKIRNGRTKWIIRKACREYLPRKVVQRKDKMGFPAPFARWLREGKSKDDIAKIIFAFGEREIVPKETIKELYKAHMNFEADFNQILFRFLSLELWMQACSK